ncbi:serine/threonine-protein kinase EDR1 isoform X2 [Medicago truncatula]|uniref:serine/threonine-protein kinase EDR1 isoform X2 n=1 Tax=Medicago truncatula TaxID=3880 RepID=UPI000D2F35D3|nr:serine/threonine-protein kinase EDR1 isoform X2 [Medicago truncatula]
MERTREDARMPSDFIGKFGSVSLGTQDETLNNKESPRHSNQDFMSPQRASQILWHTGMLSEPIPNGFYSVVPEKRLKKLFDSIPTLDELQALGGEGFRADVIVVDAKKDRKLSMLKQLIVTLVKGLNTNPGAIIKKIAGLVSDFYKRPNVESPAKAALEESSHMFESHGVQMLGQIKHGSCRPRAILFKVLADTVGLESRLMMGFPTDGAADCVDSYKHMSVIVALNSVELLVDLMRFPGQLLPRSIKSILMTHISAAGESDSAENDSCDSPLEPNSPLYGVSESAEKDDNLQFHRRFEASSNVSSPPLRNMMLRSNTCLDRKLSEPNIATSFGRRSRRKVIAEQRTASSSPEHPSFQARGQSKLGGEKTAFRDFADDQATSRSSYKSDGASSSGPRRIRRRSISITPEIGDDIARAVRAMNEKLKQNRLLREQGDDSSLPHSPNDRTSSAELQKNLSNFRLDGHETSPLYPLYRDNVPSQKAVSLPSSPHDYRRQTSETSRPLGYELNDELESTWNKILESSMADNKPLLPYEEWNIDFSELTVGTRVGIGFFGEVFRGIWNGTDVAIKVFLEQDLTAENMEDFCNEISILSRLRHPNVILFLGACTKPPRLSMVTEYMEMGSLFYLIHVSGQKKKLSWRRRLKMLRDICRGLMHIHRMKIIHRDVKSANCLVDKHWTVKVCDFGLSRIITESPMRDSSSAGTPEWMAPELIRNEPFTEKCDIFSLGVIMWELCNLSRPWEGVPPERVVYTVANEGSRLEIPEGPLGRLISECWAEPNERPSCEEILSRLVDIEYSMS